MSETLEFVLVVGALPNPSSPDPEQRFPVLLSISVPKNCEHELNETQSPQPSTPGRQRPENRFTTWSETVGTLLRPSTPLRTGQKSSNL